MPPTTPPTAPQAPAGVTPPDSARRSRSGHHVRPDRFELTLSVIGLAVYLWVIHSFRLPLASLGVGLGLVGLFLQAGRLRLPAPLLLFGAYVVWTGLTAPFATVPLTSWDAAIELGKLWLIFLVATNIAHSRQQLYAVIVIWLAMFAFYPVRGTLVNFAIGNQRFGRYAWNFTFSNPNDLAALALPILALCIVVLQGSPGRRSFVRFSALCGVVILPAMIVITQSRGGILALFTLGLLVLVQYRRKAKALAFSVLAGGVIVLSAPPEVWERLGGLIQMADTENLANVDAEGSAQQRFEIWKVAVAIAADHPITGTGLGSYARMHAEYASSGRFDWIARGNRDTHSIYMNVLAETGVVGLALFLAMISVILWQGWRCSIRMAPLDPNATHQVQTLLIGLVAILQAGIFSTLQRLPYMYLYMGIVLAALAVLTRGVPAGAKFAPPRHVAPRRARTIPRPQTKPAS